jgi:hypothetical protein
MQDEGPGQDAEESQKTHYGDDAAGIYRDIG